MNASTGGSRQRLPGKIGGIMAKTLKVPRQVKSQQVKERIFKAAQELLQKNGFEYLTVSNVCSAAGVSAGSFYHHFGSKDELLSYYFVAGYEKYRKQFDAIVGGDIIHDVIAAYDLYVAFCREQSIGFMKIFYTPENKSLRVNMSRDGGSSFSIPVVTKTVELIEQARLRGYLPVEESSAQLGRELCTLVKGCIFDWCLQDGELDLEGLVRRMLRRHMLGIVTDKYKSDFSDLTVMASAGD